jgi:hypothetical protein
MKTWNTEEALAQSQADLDIARRRLAEAREHLRQARKVADEGRKLWDRPSMAPRSPHGRAHPG